MSEPFHQGFQIIGGNGPIPVYLASEVDAYKASIRELLRQSRPYIGLVNSEDARNLRSAIDAELEEGGQK